MQSLDILFQYRKGSFNANADALSRPVYTVEVDLRDITTVDPIEDEALIQYLKNQEHLHGLSKSRKKEIETKAARFQWKNGKLLYWDDVKDAYLKVPKIEQRLHLVETAHVLGHFGFDAKMARIREKYYWLTMRKDI